VSTTTKEPPSRKKPILVALVAVATVSLGIFIFAYFDGIIPGRRPPVQGTLPQRDLAEIRRLVRHEIWRSLPRFSAALSLREFERQIRARWSEHIMQITINADGTVRVETIMKVRSGPKFSFTCGSIYTFQKDRHGWRVISRGFWQS
jgi:hypothetical protein